MLGPFLTTCGTIDFLVDDCLRPFFITVGTWIIWSKKWGLTIWQKGQKKKQGQARPAAAGADLAVSYESFDAVAMRVITGTSRWTILLFLHCWFASAGGLGRGVTINTNFTHSCLRVYPGFCWCQCVLFSEKCLKLVTVNRRECDRQLF